MTVLLASIPLLGGRPIPVFTTALSGCLAMALSCCLSIEEAYAAIDRKVVFLLAEILPLGVAMETSAAAEPLARYGVNLVGGLRPVAVLAMFYVLTALLAETMNHNAATVQMAPIALSTAANLAVSPKPFLLAIMFAASTAFATPVGYQTNTMVYNSGGYRFTDFLGVSAPLNISFAIVAFYYIPKFFRF